MSEQDERSDLERRLLERAGQFAIGAGGHPDNSIEYAWLEPHPGVALTDDVRERIMVTPKLLREAAARIAADREEITRLYEVVRDHGRREQEARRMARAHPEPGGVH